MKSSKTTLALKTEYQSIVCTSVPSSLSILSKRSENWELCLIKLVFSIVYESAKDGRSLQHMDANINLYLLKIQMASS